MPTFGSSGVTLAGLGNTAFDSQSRFDQDLLFFARCRCGVMSRSDVMPFRTRGATVHRLRAVNLCLVSNYRGHRECFEDGSIDAVCKLGATEIRQLER